MRVSNCAKNVNSSRRVEGSVGVSGAWERGGRRDDALSERRKARMSSHSGSGCRQLGLVQGAKALSDQQDVVQSRKDGESEGRP